jgi:hypothetical protein
MNLRVIGVTFSLTWRLRQNVRTVNRRICLNLRTRLFFHYKLTGAKALLVEFR